MEAGGDEVSAVLRARDFQEAPQLAVTPNLSLVVEVDLCGMWRRRRV